MQEILDQVLAQNIFALLLIFTRIGTAMFLIPGIGDTSVPPRVRLLFSFTLSLILLPILGPSLPQQPEDFGTLGLLLGTEFLIGAFFGTLVRMMLTALEVAGMIISLNAGLSNAFLFNPQFGSQSSLPGVMLGTAGMVLIFVTNLHHVLIMALIDTYEVFPAGSPVVTQDFANEVARQVAMSFEVGARLASPFIIFGLMFFMVLGILARLMPQLQIFFIALPLQQLVGLLLLVIGTGAIMLYWLTYFENRFNMLFNGG